jgi:hypothetical protein
MNPFYLCATLLCLFFVSCKKEDTTTRTPQENDNPIVTFTVSKLGANELYATAVEKIPIVNFSGGTPNRTGTFKISGANGLKRATDTSLHGTFTFDADGKADLSLPGIQAYKDGDLTIEATLINPAQTITAKTTKVESVIRHYRDFTKLTWLCKSDSSTHYTQENDFAFPDTVFDRAVFNARFFGSYDGQGHKITNLRIRTVGLNVLYDGDWEVGLFSFIGKGGTLKNIRLELADSGYTTNGIGTHAGGLVSTAWGSDIINCSVTGDMYANIAVQYSYAGGIVATADSARIAGCSYRGNIVTHYAGGIVSDLYNSTIDYCYSVVDYTVQGGGGMMWNAIGNIRVSNCYAIGSNVGSTFQYAGIGFDISTAQYYNCYANAGRDAAGVSILPTADINTHLAAMTASGDTWPAWVAKPADNKPYKNDTDASAPMKLWWE